MRFPSPVALIALCISAATCAAKTTPPAAQPTTAAAPVETVAVARATRAEGAAAALMAAEPASLSGSKFDPECEIPFGSIGKVRAIDNACGPEGAGSAKSQLQNAVKNNFCASGTPVNFNRQFGDRLNTAVNNLNPPLSWGSGTNIPADRTPLQNLITVGGKQAGEGSLVRTVAYFMHANYSNTSNGEKVNCDRTGQANNDIHVYLAMMQGEDDRCQSLNAEISPHFRPTAWEEIVGLDINERRPMRITGQLMLDASHKPCSAGHRSSPARFTSWEIHPVYNMEVCKNKSKASCRIGTNSDWIPFDEWLGEDEHEEEPQQDTLPSHLPAFTKTSVRNQ